FLMATQKTKATKTTIKVYSTRPWPSSSIQSRCKRSICDSHPLSVDMRFPRTKLGLSLTQQDGISWCDAASGIPWYRKEFLCQGVNSRRVLGTKQSYVGVPYVCTDDEKLPNENLSPQPHPQIGIKGIPWARGLKSSRFERL